jgi:DNA-binding NarL/FixJ family response regulator
VRVAIADDSTLFRRGLALLLQDTGVEVTTEARTGDELVARVAGDPPDVAILDIRMPPTFTDEGLTGAEQLRAAHPGQAILVLSTYAETPYALRLLQNGPAGLGYLLKDRVADAATLHDALIRLIGGESVVDPEIITKLVARERLTSDLDRLTERERDVLHLMAEGRSNAGIGKRLYVSPKTVEAHVAAVFSKLGLPAGTEDNRRVLAVLTWLRSV